MIHSFKFSLLTALSLSVAVLSLSNAQAMVSEQDVNAAKISCTKAKKEQTPDAKQVKAKYKKIKAQFHKQELELLADHGTATHDSLKAYLKKRKGDLEAKFAKLKGNDRGKPEKLEKYHTAVDDINVQLEQPSFNSMFLYAEKRLEEVNARIAKMDKKITQWECLMNCVSNARVGKPLKKGLTNAERKRRILI